MIFFVSYIDVGKPAVAGFCFSIYRYRRQPGADGYSGGLYWVAQGYELFQMATFCGRFSFSVVRHCLSFQPLPCDPLSVVFRILVPALHCSMWHMGRRVSSVLPPSVLWSRLVVSHPPVVGLCQALSILRLPYGSVS